MAQNLDGVNIIITGDGSQAIRELGRIEQSINSLLALEVGSKLEAGFGNIFNTIAASLQRVASAVQGVMRSALAIGGGFEAQMTSVKVISGATEEELEKLTAKAREMGATLPISAKDAATAMTLLAQRGTSVKDILASVADVANLAISQGVSMGSAADLLGSTITNFGLAMEDASKVTAIFNNASNQSALNMSKLTEALKYVGPTAGSIGMELTEAISAMEALANAGLTGEMTGTGLAMVLTKLASKTRIMGVETKDVQGKLRPLGDIFSELQAKGFSLAEATAEFGARGRLAALNLAKGSAALKENEERLKQWGSTQAAVDEKAKTFTNTMAAFRSAVEEIHIEIFDQIKQQSKGVAAGLTEIVRALSEWVGQTKIAEQSLNAFLNGLGFNIPAGADFKKLLEQIDIKAFTDKVQSFGATIRSIAESIASFADKIKTPLLFLIKHLDTFATISFWGWITGKALQVPAILIGIAGAFGQLYSTVKALSALNLTNLMTLLANPAFLTLAATGIGVYAAKKMSDSQEVLRKAVDVEKRYLQEQAQADSTIDLDIKLNVRTGFEKLPESWTKASDELREKANETVQALRDAFRKNVATAMDTVTDRFPIMAQALDDLAKNMDDTLLRKLTQALQGNKEVYSSLSEPMKNVVIQLAAMKVEAGQATQNFDEMLVSLRQINQQTEGNTASKSNIQLFSEELSASVASLVEAIPDNIEKLQTFMDGKNLTLAVDVSLEQANKQIQELSKSIGEKFNIPAEIVNSGIFSQLKKLAEQGNKTAQSLVNGWTGAGNSLDSFMKSAQDAVKYLGASPEKFAPALNSLTKGIQKIDPLTGKVTEQFKKAHDALKQWANVTFDQLAQRIQRLRKAVEGGFIDQKALEAEFRRASEQVKVQIATELSPSRSQFQSEQAFNAVVASEYVSRMGELGGQAFMDLLQKEFASLYSKSGSAIGDAIMRQVEQGLSSNGAVMKINGIDMLKQDKQQQVSLNFQNLTKAFSDSVSPFVSKLEQFNSKQSISSTDISSRFPEIVSALNKLTTGIESNNSIIGRANDAMLSLMNSIGNINLQNNNNVEAAVRDYSSDFASVLKEFQAVSAGLAAVQNAAQANVEAVNGVATAVGSVTSAVSLVEAAVKSQQGVQVSTDGNNFSQAIAPLLAVMQDIAGTSSAIHSIEQNRSSFFNEIVNSINAVDVSVRAIDSTTNQAPQSENYNVDGGALSQAIVAGLSPVLSSNADLISQAIISALSSMLAKNEGGSTDYQSVLADVVKNVLALQQSIDALKKSTDDNKLAFSNAQSAWQNIPSAEVNVDLLPVSRILQSMSSEVSAIQSTSQNHTASMSDLLTAITAVTNAVKAQGTGNVSVDAEAISKAITAGVHPFVDKLDANSTAYQSASEAVSKNLLTFGQSVDALKKSTDSNINAMSSLQNSLSSINNNDTSKEDFTGALTPLLNAVQSLAATVGSIQNINRANSSAITGVTNAVRSVETAVKAINAGNSYDIDINQQGFMIEKKSDADMLARSTVSALRSGLGNGGV